MRRTEVYLFFFFNDTATTEIYTLSLHDALPISMAKPCPSPLRPTMQEPRDGKRMMYMSKPYRSEEHTSELQSHLNLVCRLLLEKKKNDKLNRGRAAIIAESTDLALSSMSGVKLR